jgi:hypothetical protein
MYEIYVHPLIWFSDELIDYYGMTESNDGERKEGQVDNGGYRYAV